MIFSHASPGVGRRNQIFGEASRRRPLAPGFPHGPVDKRRIFGADGIPGDTSARIYGKFRA